MAPILEFKDYTVVWIAPLTIEARAAIGMLDKIHEGNFPSDRGDQYQYIGGEINGHNVIIASFPPTTQYGCSFAAALAAQVRKCCTSLWFGLLVGIAAGLPNLSLEPCRDIRLGDVLVSLPDSNNPGVTQAAIGRIKTLADFQGYTFLEYLKRIEDITDSDDNLPFKYPGQEKDILYDEKDQLVPRHQREKSCTRVWYGNIGSGSAVIKSSRKRDKYRDKYNIIGLDMEAAATMNSIPVGHIRGVCDYADAHKTKEWQGYAAAVAASYARELLCTINPTKQQKQQKNLLQPFDTIPFPRNQNLVPRDDILHESDKLLPIDTGPVGPPFGVLEDPGKQLWQARTSHSNNATFIRKTQIAIEYAYRRKEKASCSVFWVHASTEARFTGDYNKIAKRAGIPELNGVEMLQSVHDWLEKQVNWLLIIDNADDLFLFTPTIRKFDQNAGVESPQLLQYIPHTYAGSILWTSRDGRIIRSLVNNNQGLRINKMALGESLKLLRGIGSGSQTIEATIDEEKLLGPKGLDGLPLAITQAQAYMEMSGIPTSTYLRLLHQSESDLLDSESPDPYRLEVPNSVMRTWRISLDRIAATSPCAENIMRTIAFFDNQGIPFEFIREAAAPESNEILILQTAGLLQQYSFLQIQETASNRDLPTYEQHRLVQLAMQNTLNQSLIQEFSKKALEIMTKLLPWREFENRDLCKLYLPHALKACTSRYGEALTLDTRSPDLLHLIGRYYSEEGLFQEAERFRSKELEIRKSSVGEENINTMNTMYDLAPTWNAQGHRDKAEPLEVEVLDLQKTVLGERHPDTIRAMANLAATWNAQGHHDKAEPLKVEVLDLRKTVLGERHPDTIRAMANLAATWHAQGLFDKAELLRVQVLDLQKTMLGAWHPNTRRAMRNLANTWEKMGRYEEADALRKREEFLMTQTTNSDSSKQGIDTGLTHQLVPLQVGPSKPSQLSRKRESSKTVPSEEPRRSERLRD